MDALAEPDQRPGRAAARGRRAPPAGGGSRAGRAHAGARGAPGRRPRWAPHTTPWPRRSPSLPPAAEPRSRLRPPRRPRRPPRRAGTAAEALRPPAEARLHQAPSDEATGRVLELVAEETGYPTDLLDLDLDLEADLGIDTVKQAEVFAAIREAYGIPRDDTLKLRDYPTLNHVAGFVRERAPARRPPRRRPRPPPRSSRPRPPRARPPPAPTDR